MPSPSDPTSTFIDVYVEPCTASEDGVSMRFKRVAGDTSAMRPVRELSYESEDGLDGRWAIEALESDDGPGEAAHAVQVEDSSDGTVWLLVGGRAGLRLTHRETGAVAHEPYLTLALSTALD
jgi:hypothetical protein